MTLGCDDEIGVFVGGVVGESVGAPAGEAPDEPIANPTTPPISSATAASPPQRNHRRVIGAFVACAERERIDCVGRLGASRPTA